MLDAFNALGLYDFWLNSFTSSQAGDDVAEIHAGTNFPTRCATLRFFNVEYISLPTLFHHAQVRLATNDELRAIRKLVEFEAQLFAIDAEVGDPEEQRTYFVAASDVMLDAPMH